MTEELSYSTISICEPKEALKFLTQHLGFFTYAPLSPVYQIEKHGVMIGNKFGNNYLLQLKSNQSSTKNKAKKPIIIHTNDCLKDCHDLTTAGIKLLSKPQYTPYGLQAVVADEWGNRYTILEKRKYAQEESI